jgi:hypothetical protein
MQGATHPSASHLQTFNLYPAHGEKITAQRSVGFSMPDGLETYHPR